MSQPAVDGGAPPAVPVMHTVDDPLFDRHRSGAYHPERPERLGAARRALARCASAGIALSPVKPRDATDAELARAHAPDYLDELAGLSGHTASLDADTYLAPSSVAAARRAAGAGLALVEACLSMGSRAAPNPGVGSADHPPGPAFGVALLRPPGHHATRAQGGGFCLVNNVAIAAYGALELGLSRVAIVDWDVHHGNGTQDIFWADPRVLYLSLHEFPFYPGTGAVSEVGAGEGKGFTVNVPLSPGATGAVYALAFEQVVVPVLDRFGPELVLVSAGYDAHRRDPLASMRLDEGDFAAMGRSLAGVAREHAGGRLLYFLEGGYDLAALEASLAASVLGALGRDPAPDAAAAEERGPVTRPHLDEVAAARRGAARFWPGV